MSITETQKGSLTFSFLPLQSSDRIYISKNVARQHTHTYTEREREREKVRERGKRERKTG